MQIETGNTVRIEDLGVVQPGTFEVIGEWRGDLRLRDDRGCTFCVDPRHVVEVVR